MFYLLALNYRMFLMVSGQVAPQEHMAGQLEHPSREHLTRCWAHAGGADGTCSILLKDQGNEGMNIRFPTVLLFAMVPLLWPISRRCAAYRMLNTARQTCEIIQGLHEESKLECLAMPALALDRHSLNWHPNSSTGNILRLKAGSWVKCFRKQMNIPALWPQFLGRWTLLEPAHGPFLCINSHQFASWLFVLLTCWTPIQFFHIYYIYIYYV